MKDDNKDLFELMLASNDSEEQFPVLKAFQSYLEAEREKSRRRQSQITNCFLVSTIILVVCFCVLGFAFFSKFIEKDNQLTQLLLLERAGIKAVPQEVVVPAQQTAAPVVDSQANEYAALGGNPLQVSYFLSLKVAHAVSALLLALLGPTAICLAVQ